MRPFPLQRSPYCVLSDEAVTDSHARHRVDLAHDEIRVRGSASAFPVG